MSDARDLLTANSHGELCRVEKEQLSGSDTRLTSFFFNQGANVYVFSYEKEGMKRHTFIDAGDLRYRNEILPILIENDINPANIERIILTHRHPDHVGLTSLLAKESGSTVLVHPDFRSFIEGKTEEQRWLDKGALSQLRECSIEYLPESSNCEVRSIGGVDFPSLIKPIEIGTVGTLTILACPESSPTHSPDQIIVLYSPLGGSQTQERLNKDSHPTDGMLFSGDLWLMRGPIRGMDTRNISFYLRYGFRRMKNLMSRKGMRWDSREQDSKAKEALKRGFHLIRVNPGHGDAFIGSSIIPFGLLADRDLIRGLGYPMNTNREILKQRNLASRITALKEQAYSSFIKEILFWKDLGYTSGEISALLVRVYKEQSGGGALAAMDRKQRRKGLKTTLTRIRDDKGNSEDLHQLAGSTLVELKRVS